jgi:cell division septum initiation protein DivIVA
VTHMRSQQELTEADGGRLFKTVMHGYDRRQVERRIAELRARIAALETELEAAHRQAGTVGDPSVAPQGQEGLPHDQISSRMRQILRLADEEAQQARAEAAQQAAAVLARAQEEARALLEAAQSTAEEVLRAAMRRSEEELAAARVATSRLIRSAREEAATARQ